MGRFNAMEQSSISISTTPKYPQYLQKQPNNIDVNKNSAQHIVIQGNLPFSVPHDQLCVNYQISHVYNPKNHCNQIIYKWVPDDGEISKG